MKNKKLNVINTDAWIDENKNCFAPPVCNKLMHISTVALETPCGCFPSVSIVGMHLLRASDTCVLVRGGEVSTRAFDFVVLLESLDFEE